MDSTERFQEVDVETSVVAACLAESPRRMPTTDAVRLLIHQFDLNRVQARTVIRRLVTTGDLTYTYEHGCSFLEPSFGQPVRVGEKVVLVPAGHSYQAGGRKVIVHIAPGASFGCGRHPTTRLAIRGIEQALADAKGKGGPERIEVLDIGTGSGVLVIAAVKLGAGGGVGIDTDSCARFEARRNVEHNRLGDAIRISDQSLDGYKPTGRFYLIAANLRLPTLRNAASRISRLAALKGKLVLSGIRAEEVNALCDTYRAAGCRSIWTAVEKGWAAVVCQKQGV